MKEKHTNEKKQIIIKNSKKSEREREIRELENEVRERRLNIVAT